MATSLQLEGYYIQELGFRIRKGVSVAGTHQLRPGLHPQLAEPLDDAAYSVHVEVKLTRNKTNPHRWRVRLNLSSAEEDNQNPYEFSTVLVGFFRLTEEYDEEDLQFFIGKNAPTLLFSAAREAIATATGRGPFPALVLPAVVFPSQPDLKLLPSAKKPARKAAKKSSKTRSTRKSKKGAR
ncbi:MAG TPA: protein-export chaperone SecB [Pyrinomonadaceae bacterium]|jgi:preprotein translocase subunit SecB